ncbi:HK97 family phage prohead protease [Pseudonocardia oroxyli]|uniref:Prohead serine protease n=1 Tax=Pseudonocardia oroxyli TaxID=366584 RepID=A0A1G7YMJ7_PSEOR|nr:HK97 family phage prohead protease [Pseudonocardia oroxyli]SDG97050.1 prohead serine protease [Pseudonocardia oroxyli]
METKTFSGATIKSTDKGIVRVRFATLGVIDADKDVTLSGAFADGAKVAVSAYGHETWNGALPVGVGRIEMKGDSAEAELRFFLDTTSGRDTFNTIKNLGTDPGSEYSYGFTINDSEYGDYQGQRVRFLKSLTVHEISPVLLGAGVGTGTLEVKRVNASYDGLSPRERGEMRAMADQVELDLKIAAFNKRYGNNA